MIERSTQILVISLADSRNCLAPEGRHNVQVINRSSKVPNHTCRLSSQVFAKEDLGAMLAPSDGALDDLDDG